MIRELFRNRGVNVLKKHAGEKSCLLTIWSGRTPFKRGFVQFSLTSQNSLQLFSALLPLTAKTNLQWTFYILLQDLYHWTVRYIPALLQTARLLMRYFCLLKTSGNSFQWFHFTSKQRLAICVWSHPFCTTDSDLFSKQRIWNYRHFSKDLAAWEGAMHFSQILFQFGEAQESNDSSYYIKLPHYIHSLCNRYDLCACMYKAIEERYKDNHWMDRRAVITTRNVSL